MFNTIILSGNLVNDVTLGTTQDGKKYCYGKIAVNQLKDRNGADRDPMFFEFTAFGYDAETLAMVAKKGDSIVVSGRLEEESYTSEKDGKTYINKKIVANTAKALVKRPQQETAPATQEDPFAQFK